MQLVHPTNLIMGGEMSTMNLWGVIKQHCCYYCGFSSIVVVRCMRFASCLVSRRSCGTASVLTTTHAGVIVLLFFLVLFVLFLHGTAKVTTAFSSCLLALSLQPSMHAWTACSPSLPLQLKQTSSSPGPSCMTEE